MKYQIFHLLRMTTQTHTLLFFCFLPLISMELTGLHDLFTVNCSLPELYIPQGPYLFSHHWPFTSISVIYHRQINHGTCHTDGSLYFFLNTTRFCFGIYRDGQANMTCQYETGEYCLMHLATSDGSRLTCI